MTIIISLGIRRNSEESFGGVLLFGTYLYVFYIVLQKMC